MNNLLAISLLKGFQCHNSQSFAPKISFRYEQNKWIIRLLYIEKSFNPNETIVLDYIHIPKSFLNKDIVFVLDDNNKIVHIEEYKDETTIKSLLTKEQYDKFQEYKNNNYHPIFEQQKEILFQNDQFYVSKSNIPNAGFGLYSKNEFHKGDFLMTFQGKKNTLNDFCSEFKDKNCIHYEYAVTAENYNRKKYVFDPIIDEKFIPNESNFGPVINEPPPNEYSNCESVSVSSKNTELRVDLIATRFISKNEEIYMLYNRQSNYLIGNATPLPLSLKFISSKSRFGTLLCYNMQWYKNEDWFRFIYWYNECQMSIYTFGENTNVPKEFELFHLQDIEDKIKTKNNNVGIFIDYGQILKIEILEKYFTLGLSFVILPFDDDFYANFLFGKNYKFQIIEAESKYFFDSYDARKYGKLLKITKNEKNSFTRFRDVWNEERIKKDKSLTEEQKSQWLKKYL